MPIVIGDLSGLGQGITQAGSALAGALEKRAERRLAGKRRGALSDVLQEADLQTQAGQQDFLQRTTAAGIPTQEALGILDRAIKQQSGLQRGFQIDDPSELESLFSRLGVQEDQARNYADLYGNLSQGGRTSFANMLIDNLQRGQLGPSPQTGAAPAGAPGGVLQPLQGDLGNMDPQAEGFEFPEVEIFEGLVPKERVAREKELFNANAKDFNELSTKLKGLRDDTVRVEQIQRYNESGRLPEGMEKLNINWKTGDIRFPALANAETQGFVKTINDFTVKAKETFGARVTNFELGAFMKRLPTLANSTEGRRLIVEQMKSMGDLDRLYYDSIKEVYDNYGLRGIDRQKAEQIAADMRAPKEEALKQKVADSVSSQEVYEMKLSLPEGRVLVEFEGRRGDLPVEKVDTAVARGARVL